MEQYAQLKKTVEPSGNAGHVYLPKDLVGREVTILVPQEFEIREIFSMLKGNLDRIMGVYLVGSQARGEGSYDSDIDIAVVTDGKHSIKSDKLDVFCISYNPKKPLSLSAKSMLMEARPILNSRLLEELKKKPFTSKTEFEIGRSALKIVKGLLKEYGEDEKIGPGVVYSLVLRMKTYLTYKCLKEGKKYNTKLLLEELEKYTRKAKNMLEVYRSVRDNRQVYSDVEKKDAERILEALIKVYK